MSAKRLMQVLLLMSQPAGSTGGQCRYGSFGALAHFLLAFSFWSKSTVWCLSLCTYLLCLSGVRGKEWWIKLKGSQLKYKSWRLLNILVIFKICLISALSIRDNFYMVFLKGYFKHFCSPVQKAWWDIFSSRWRGNHTACCLLSSRRMKCIKRIFFQIFVTLQYTESRVHIFHP